MKVAIGIALLIALIDFAVNAWVGVSVFSSRTLKEPKQWQPKGEVVAAKELVKFEHDAFGIRKPILVSDLRDEQEKARLAQLQAQQAQAEDDQQYRIKVADYLLELKGIVTVDKEVTALIRAAHKSDNAKMIKVQTGDQLLERLKVIAIKQTHITLLPLVSEDVVSDFSEIRLHIYKPFEKKEVL